MKMIAFTLILVLLHSIAYGVMVMMLDPSFSDTGEKLLAVALALLTVVFLTCYIGATILKAKDKLQTTFYLFIVYE